MRTACLWLVWFCVNFSYYGASSSGFRRSWWRRVRPVRRSFGFTLVITLAQLPGYAVAAWLIEVWGRRLTLSVFLVGSAASRPSSSAPPQGRAGDHRGGHGAVVLQPRGVGRAARRDAPRCTPPRWAGDRHRVGSRGQGRVDRRTPLVVPPLLLAGGAPVLFVVFAVLLRHRRRGRVGSRRPAARRPVALADARGPAVGWSRGLRSASRRDRRLLHRGRGRRAPDGHSAAGPDLVAQGWADAAGRIDEHNLAIRAASWSGPSSSSSSSRHWLPEADLTPPVVQRRRKMTCCARARVRRARPRRFSRRWCGAATKKGVRLIVLSGANPPRRLPLRRVIQAARRSPLHARWSSASHRAPTSCRRTTGSTRSLRPCLLVGGPSDMNARGHHQVAARRARLALGRGAGPADGGRCPRAPDGRGGGLLLPSTSALRCAGT